MKIAFDVDVLAKQMRVRDYVYKVADWGYKYIEQSPQVQINPFYKHPLFSEDLEQEYRQALKDTGVEISSFICVYRWSGPTEVQRQHAVANWKALIKIAVNMGVQVINTELSGDPHQPEICNGMFFRSMEELLPIFEREGIRCEIQSHPYDFCELNDETVDMVNHFRSDNVKYVYSSPHAFYYDKGKGDFAHQLRYAGKALSHVLFADTMNHTIDCRYIVNPPGTVRSFINLRQWVKAKLTLTLFLKHCNGLCQPRVQVGGPQLLAVLTLVILKMDKQEALSVSNCLVSRLIKRIDKLRFRYLSIKYH